MSRRIPEAEAVAAMVAAGVDPQEPYPGVREPWRCRCRTCGNEVTPRLDGVRRGHGACRYCGTRERVAARATTPEQAIARVRQAGGEPLEPYPGRANLPWLMTCNECGEPVRVPLVKVKPDRIPCVNCHFIRAGRKRRTPEEKAVEVMRAARAEPLDSYPGAREPWRCRCQDCGEVVTPTFTNVKKGQSACRPCAIKRRGARRAIPADQAEARVRAAGGTPVEPYPGRGNMRWRVRCNTCGEEVAILLSQVGDSIRCPTCGRRSMADANRMPESEARERMLAAGADPNGPYPGTQKPWKATCLECGGEIAPRVSTLGRVGPCNACGRRRTAEALMMSGERAVADMREWGVEPSEPYPGSQRKWKGTCLRCGSPVETTYGSARRTGNGCRQCGIQKGADARRTPSAQAVAEMEAAGLTPLEPFVNGSTPWRCRCEVCGNEVRPTLQRVRAGMGCNFCGYKRGGLVQRIPEEEARARAEAWGYTPDPDVPYPGSGQPWPGRCHKCNAHIAPRLDGYLGGGGCCAACAPHGFDVTASATVYLIRHESGPVMKVGVAGDTTDRIAKHQRRGWEVVGRWPVPTGRVALDHEAAVLAWWASQDALPCQPDDVPAGDGFTESVWIGCVDVPDTLAFIATLVDTK